MPMPLAQCFRDCSSVVHSLVAVILDSQELRAVWFLQMDFNVIGLPEQQMRKPEREQSVNSSRGVSSLTALPN